MVVIATSDRDEHADAVEFALAKKGAAHHRFRTDGYSKDHRIALRCDGRYGAGLLAGPEGSLALADVRSVWWRRQGKKPNIEVPSEQHLNFIISENAASFRAISTLGARSFWVNPMEATQRAEGNRLAMLREAADVGFVVPRSLVTNDPSAARDFHAECGEQIVYKLLGNAWTLGFYTSVVTREQLDETETMYIAPCLFQERVPKRSELRVNIIGRKIFATEILSQALPESSVDFRSIPDYKNRLEHIPYDLPETVVGMLRELVKRTELAFGAADIIITPEGEYVFLEINPQGQWLWCEEVTGQPLLESFSEMLRQGTIDYDDRPPESQVHYRDFLAERGRQTSS